jgi:transposase
VPPVNRNHPRRAGSSESKFAVMEFLAEYPDDASCLDYLWRTLYSPDGRHYHCPKCDAVRTFHRVESRPLYSCAKCGKGIHPTAGTIFEKSSTSLHLWFYGIYLMSSTRCGISAKQLERELGVTYKTAWRMFNKIRSLLGQDDEEMFAGTIEMDEAFMGGKAKWRSKSRNRKIGTHKDRFAGKTQMLGMVERGQDGRSGRIRAKVIDSLTTDDERMDAVVTKVLPGTAVYTDESPHYQDLPKSGYPHRRVNHAEKVYVSGDVHTNTIEGFWALTKRGIGGVYHAVSAKHLQSYLDEYVFRYNNRDHTGRGMFNAFLDRVIREAEPRLTSEKPSEVPS